VRQYGSITSRLTRITDAPISTSCAQVFNRFEGAYRYFTNDRGIPELFKVISQIGISEMMDNASALKTFITQQISTFLMSRDLTKPDDGGREAEIYTLFDRKFKEIKKMTTKLYIAPTEQHVLQPFLYSVLTCLTELIVANMELFDIFRLESGCALADARIDLMP
jgi:hypothetical protein